MEDPLILFVIHIHASKNNYFPINNSVNDQLTILSKLGVVTQTLKIFRVALLTCQPAPCIQLFTNDAPIGIIQLVFCFHQTTTNARKSLMQFGPYRYANRPISHSKYSVHRSYSRVILRSLIVYTYIHTQRWIRRGVLAWD